MNTSFDVVIVGGGLVGSSLAIALNRRGLSVALLEASAPRAVSAPAPADERNLALAAASVTALETLGVWRHVSNRASAIREVHVNREGEFGTLRLQAEREGLASFGAVLPAHLLGAALQQELQHCDAITQLSPADLRAVTMHGDTLQLDIQAGAQSLTWHTRLLVGADGTNSAVRQLRGIGTDAIDYAQTLFVATVVPERPLHGRAYERFSDAGPVALLPLAERRAGLVLSVATDGADAVAALDDAAFLAYAQQRFGWRAGRLQRPGRRSRHPIRRITAQALTAPRTVLVGNAAQTIHPIGAQGFNLGLRDALTLAELLIARARDGGDPGDASLLQAYAQRREPDRRGTLAFSDGLVRLACHPSGLLAPWRSLGLLLLDGLPALRRQVARRGMGFRGTATAYARGVQP